MLIDLHAHSTSTSDCFFDAHDVIQAVKKAGLDGLAFTDTAFHDDAADLRKFGAEHGVAVLFGREVYTSGGHLLVFTPDYEALRACPWDGASELPEPAGVIEHVKKMGGAVVAAHPYCREYEHPMGDGVFTLKGLNAIESENATRGKMTNDLASEAAFSMQLPCCGGSDGKQSMDHIGGAATLLKKPVGSEADLVEALQGGAFWPVRIGEFPPKEDPRDRHGFRRDGGGRRDGGRGGFRRDDRPFDRAQGGHGGRRDGGGYGGGRGSFDRGGRRDDRRGGFRGGAGRGDQRGGRGGHRDRGRGHGGGDRGPVGGGGTGQAK